MPTKKGVSVDWESLLAAITRGKTAKKYSADRRIFDQGQPADSISYIRKGTVKLSVISQQGKESRAEVIIPRVNQAKLAKMVGTTRSRISHFMNRFRQHGFIEYDNAELTVHSTLLNVILHD